MYQAKCYNVCIVFLNKRNQFCNIISFTQNVSFVFSFCYLTCFHIEHTYMGGEPFSAKNYLDIYNIICGHTTLSCKESAS